MAIWKLLRIALIKDRQFYAEVDYDQSFGEELIGKCYMSKTCHSQNSISKRNTLQAKPHLISHIL